MITGHEVIAGEVRIAVFNTPESWLGTPVYTQVIPISGDTCVWKMEAVPAGTYGIAAFHDANSNGKNDTNLLGIPKERYGFSNAARARMGPPAWVYASFQVPAINGQVSIQLR